MTFDNNSFAIKGDIIQYHPDKFDFTYRSPKGVSMILPILVDPDFFNPGKLLEGHTYYDREILVCFDYNKKGNIVLRCLSIKPKVNV